LLVAGGWSWLLGAPLVAACPCWLLGLGLGANSWNGTDGAQETGRRAAGAVTRKQETGNRKQETGNRKQAVFPETTIHRILTTTNVIESLHSLQEQDLRRRAIAASCQPRSSQPYQP
jgi:hypothetical protein